MTAIGLPKSMVNMHIYEVFRWGNDSDNDYTGGPNGPDTCFLVRAESVEQAAALADKELARMSSQFVAEWACGVYLLGADLSTSTKPKILRGPYIEHAYIHGWRQWHREQQDGPWVERERGVVA